MAEQCLECGAVLPEGRICQEIFEEFLAFEYTNPTSYGQVHFLTVACFMVQHNRYSDEALAWMQGMLRAYLEEQLSAEQLRRRAAQGTDGHSRTWKVTRPADALPLPRVAWAVTIADIAESIKDDKTYCREITRWARATLQQMGEVIV